MDEINIENLRTLCKDETIDMTYHAYMRCEKRKILYSEIKQTIQCGEIIEYYPDDSPYQSCLILCLKVNNRPIHIVVSVGEGKLHIITAYEPTLDKWESDYKTRKVQ